MEYINKISIKARLFLIISILITVFIAFTFIVFSEINEIVTSQKEISNKINTITTPLRNISFDITSMYKLMGDLTYVSSISEVQDNINQVNEMEKRVYKNLDIIKRNTFNSRSRALEKELRDSIDAWKPIRKKTLDYRLAGDIDKAKKNRLTRGNDQTEKIELLNHEFRDYIFININKSFSDNEELKYSVFKTTLGFLIGFIILSVILSLLIVDSIIKPILTFKNIVSQNINIKDLNEVTLPGKNEITELALGFNNLISNIKKQYWLVTGINSLYAELYVEGERSAIAEKTISFISRYIGAAYGAIYLYDKDNDELNMKASFAKPDGKLTEQTFRMGEGLIGQVAKERKALYLNSIKREDLSIKAGTFNEPPLSVYFLPLHFSKKLYGVLELASFNPFSEEQFEFLAIADNAITSNLCLAEQTEQLEEQNARIMAQKEELESQYEEIYAQNEELKAQSEEITSQNQELEKVTVVLSETAERLQEANDNKNKFISTLSHELRTPLTSILGYSHLLSTPKFFELDNKQLMYINTITKNGEHLAEIIDDLLDISRIDAGKIVLNKEKTSPAGLITEVLTVMDDDFKKKNINIKTYFDPSIDKALVDSKRFKEIMINLLSNAVKYTPEQGNIIVDLIKEDDSTIKVLVKDDGKGIPSDQLDKIFEEFYQVDRPEEKTLEKGLGIGLAITRRLVELHSGRIHAESELNNGASFIFILPIGLNEQTIFTNDDIIEEFSNLPRGKKILLAEDNESIKQLIKEVLAPYDHNIIFACDGQEAIDLVIEHKPDLIFMDIRMPGIDGIEATKRIRNIPEFIATPIIALTSSSSDEAIREQLRAGCDYHISKPINFKILLSVLGKYLKEDKVKSLE